MFANLAADDTKNESSPLFGKDTKPKADSFAPKSPEVKENEQKQQGALLAFFGPC